MSSFCLPGLEELPRTRFEGGDALRERLLGDYRVHSEAADRVVADGPKAMARRLRDLDARAAHCDDMVGLRTRIGDSWETLLKEDGPDKERESALRSCRGDVAVYAAHARNLRRLRNAVCATMMEALR